MLFDTLIKGRARQSVDHDSWIATHKPKESSVDPVITWLGHATFLIQIGDFNILTDPIFDHASWLFRRMIPVGLGPEDLPRIDCVVVSHNHWDHMDSKSLFALRDRNPQMHVCAAQGDRDWFVKNKFKSVTEHMWWDQHTLVKGDRELTLSFLPAFHWSRRGLFDYNRSLWGSWMLECNGKTIYFGGDTAYADFFKEIGNAFSNIDVALLPIGPCEPRSWMEKSHMSAEQAGHAFLDLKAHHFVPMHWGTFYFGIDHAMVPIDRLTKWWDQQDTQTKKLILPKVAEPITF